MTAKPLFDPSTPSQTTLSPWEGVAAVGVLRMTADEDTALEKDEFELIAFLVQQGVAPETAQAAIHIG